MSQDPDFDYSNYAKLPYVVTKATTEVIQKVEDFVEHYYKAERVIRKRAFSIPCTIDGQRSNIGQYLVNTIANYVVTKGNQEENDVWAIKCFNLITGALAAHVIDTGDAEKLAKVEEENKRLRDIQQKLETEVLDLKQENKELHKILDNFGVSNNVTEEPKK
jgi:hypothetical protein